MFYAYAFLAAMSSSRCDVVTQSVRPFVRLSVLLVMREFFFSLGSYKVVSRKSNGCFNEVSRMFHESLMDRKFQGRLKKISRVLQEGDLREFQECFKKFLVWKFKGCVERISRLFQETFEGVSGVFLMVFEASSKGVCQTSY